MDELTRLSVDCLGFISVSVGEYEWEEDCAMFWLLSFKSMLGERGRRVGAQR